MDLNESPVAPNATQSMSLPLACMKFFGKLPGETTLEFANELKALTPKDKLDLSEMFAAVSYDIAPAK